MNKVCLPARAFEAAMHPATQVLPSLFDPKKIVYVPLSKPPFKAISKSPPHKALILEPPPGGLRLEVLIVGSILKRLLSDCSIKLVRFNSISN